MSWATPEILFAEPPACGSLALALALASSAQDIVQQDELRERVLKDQEKNDISAWSHVLRRNPPERCAARAHGLASFFSSGGPCRAMPCRELMPSH
eukprot:g9954.t1